MRSDHRQWRIAKIRHFTCVPLSYANTRFAFIDAQRRDSVLLIRGISSYKTDGSRMMPVHSTNICTRPSCVSDTELPHLILLHMGRVINTLAVYFGTNRKNPYIRLRKRTETICVKDELRHISFPIVILPQHVLRVKFSLWTCPRVTRKVCKSFSLLKPFGLSLRS